LVFYRRDAEQDLTPEAEAALGWLEGFAERLRVLREYTDKLDWPKPYLINIDAPATFEDAQAKAYEVRQFLGVGTGPAPDMFAILERVGCTVVVRDLSDGFEAMYVPQPAGIVLLNGTNKPGVRQRFTLAHELAHHLFHREGVVVDNDLFGGDWRLDQIANSFAAHFLMPRQGIEMEMLRRFGVAAPNSAEHAHWLAYAFGVSIDALCYQLQNTKLASVQETSWWRHANRKAIATALDIASNQQYQGVTGRWPPEMVQRLGYLFGQGVLDRAALEAHLDADEETVEQILASVSA
jgi:Zn-dependent peptidase ImmA (M78 family)